MLYLFYFSFLLYGLSFSVHNQILKNLAFLGLFVIIDLLFHKKYVSLAIIAV